MNLSALTKKGNYVEKKNIVFHYVSHCVGVGERRKSVCSKKRFTFR